MKHLQSYKLFNEARLFDISTIKGTGITFGYQKELNDENFIKNKTISKRIYNNKIRLNINWNDNVNHDLMKRLEARTSLKTKSELNTLIDKGLDELYLENYNYIKEYGRYSLWFSEYDFTIIVDIVDKSNITIITIIHGQRMYNVKNIIELKSKL